MIRWHPTRPQLRNGSTRLTTAKPLSVAKARKAISDYKKAQGQPEGLAELAVFYCEEVFEFLAACGMDDEDFYAALVRMFEQALQYVLALPKMQQKALLVRLDRVRHLGQTVGLAGKA